MRMRGIRSSCRNVGSEGTVAVVAAFLLVVAMAGNGGRPSFFAPPAAEAFRSTPPAASAARWPSGVRPEPPRPHVAAAGRSRGVARGRSIWTGPFGGPTPPMAAAAAGAKRKDGGEEGAVRGGIPTLSRGGFLTHAAVVVRAVLAAAAAATTLPPSTVARAFEGGVGGLGKTRPETGCRLFEEGSAPLQNERGLVTAEIRSATGRPILVEFQAPWPLLPGGGGLEARDPASFESAFVQVLPAPGRGSGRGRDDGDGDGDWRASKGAFRQLLLDSVFASRGKFGAYGTPFDVRVKTNEAAPDAGYVVTFTTLTPAMRESERQAYIKPQEVDGTLILLVVGTTRARFPPNEKTLQKVAASFQAIAAPESSLRTSR